jgi:hypothetical protein
VSVLHGPEWRYADEGAFKEAKRRYSRAPMIKSEKKIQSHPDVRK